VEGQLQLPIKNIRQEAHMSSARASDNKERSVAFHKADMVIALSNVRFRG
jgi:hypothetical protein